MASQTQIARLAKVSQSVVSRVLGGNAKEQGISDETISRVLELAKALNYRPNQAARMLLGKQTKLIGVIIRSFEDQFMTTILEEMNLRALCAGYTLLVVGFERGEFNADEIRLLESYRPCAFVVLGTTDFQTWGESFFKDDRLIIQIGQPIQDSRVITCGTNETASARYLADHLHSLGHQRIGIVGDASLASQGRAQHLREALIQMGLTVSVNFSPTGAKLGIAAGEEAARHFLLDADRAAWPTAVVATGDLIAMAFIRHLTDNGIAVPKFLSVASYNDIATAALTRPALTTIRQPVREMVRAGMDIILGASPLKSVTLDPVLVLRESTAKARKS